MGMIVNLPRLYPARTYALQGAKALIVATTHAKEPIID